MALFMSQGGCTDSDRQIELGYDPAADPAAVLGTALSQAVAEDKLVLMIAGGDWCSWCHYLQAFLEANDELYRDLEDTFVLAKVYYGEDNENTAFFSGYPQAPGYPHFWILSADGNILDSQGTAELEDGGSSYDRQVFADFIARWRNG